MWGSIWGGICLILFIIVFFSEFVCGPLLSQFFFNCSCLIKLLIFIVRVALLEKIETF
jgi:hypothetical protein